MKLNTVYPALIEQVYASMKEMGIEADKATIYKKAVEGGIVDQNGQPTAKAIESGWVTDMKEKKNMSLLEFKRMYPIFKGFPAKEFAKFGGTWYISNKIIDFLDRLSQNGATDWDTRNQISSYFTQRNYSDPQNVDELKGTIPEFWDIDDSHFHVANGEVVMDVETVIDQCEKTISGENPGNKAAARQLLRKIKEGGLND
jgi:hypothetical protein